MTATATLYGGFFKSLANKQINLNSDSFKVMLLGVGYTPSDAHQYQADISGQEITGTGYTAGGIALPTPSTSYTSPTLTFNGGTVQWLTTTITAAWYAAIVDVTPGSAATNPLLCYTAFGQAENDSDGTFQIAWNAGGIFQFSHS